MKHLVPIWVFSAFAIAQPVYDLLARNAGFFVAHYASRSEIVVLLVLLSVMMPLMVILILWLVGLIHVKLGQYLFNLTLMLLLMLMVLPILKRFDLSSEWVLAISILITIVMTVGYIKSNELRNFVSWLSPAILIFPALFLLSPDIKQLVFAGLGAQTDDQLQAIKLKRVAHPLLPPVIMLVLDEFPLTSLLDGENKINADLYPNFASFADNAHWFRNASTVSEDTLSAIPALLTGRYPQAYFLANAQGYPNNLFTLMGHYYPLQVTEVVTQLCPPLLCPREGGGAAFWNKATILLEDLSLVYAHIILPQSYTQNLPSVNLTWGNFRQNQRPTKNFIDAGQKPDVDSSLDRKAIFLNFISRIESNDNPAFHYLHIMLPHLPYDYLPSGKSHSILFKEYSLSNAVWQDSKASVHQAYRRHLFQVGFVDRLLGKLIEHLKTKNLFDQAMIVLVSDHGASFTPASPHRPVAPNNYVDIMSIPLMIKLPGQRQGEINDENIETIDVLPSMLAVLGIEAPWSMDGKPLLHNRVANLRPDKTIFTQHVAQKFTVDMETFRQAKDQALKRKFAFLAEGKYSFHPEGQSRLGEILGKKVSHYASVLSPDVEIMIDQQALLNSVAKDDAYLPVQLTGTLDFSKASTIKGADIVISVNGTLLSFADIYDIGKGKAKFSALLPEQALKEGLNKVTAHLLEYADGSIRLLEITNRHSQALSVNIRDEYRLDVGDKGEVFLIHRSGKPVKLTQAPLEGWLDLVLVRGKVININGWAADAQAMKPADEIIIFINNKYVYAGAPNIKREDVTSYYNSKAVLESGFKYTLSSAELDDLNHKNVRVFALSAGGHATELRHSQ